MAAAETSEKVHAASEKMRPEMGVGILNDSRMSLSRRPIRKEPKTLTILNSVSNSGDYFGSDLFWNGL